MATQRTEIYLEGASLDLDKNIDVDLTYSIADIENFEDRKTTYSKTVSIPATANNNFLFGSYFDVAIENPYSSAIDNVGVNFNPLKKAFVQVVVDNVEVFAGVLRLLEIKGDANGSMYYECALFGSLGGLFQTIGDKLLTDLDWSAYSSNYTIGNIQSSWANTDWIYTMADYNTFEQQQGHNDIDVNVTSFRPSFFLKTIFNKILSEAGYTSNNFWTNNLDKILPINGDEKFEIYLDNLASGTLLSGTINQNTSPSPNAIGTYTQYYLPLPGTRYIVNNTNSNLDTRVTGTINYNLTASSSLPRNFFLDIQVGGVTVATHTHTITQLGAGSFTFDFNISIPKDYLFNFVTRLQSGGTFSCSLLSTSSFLIVTNNKSLKAPILQNILITGRNFVPDNVKQSDFLKSIFNLFNLYVTSNKENEFDLIVKTYPDFYSTNYVDWTYKADGNKGFSIKPSNQYIPSAFEFKYKEDNDYYSRTYKSKYGYGFGNYKKITENEFSKDTKTTEVIFGLPITVRAGESLDMYLPAMYDIDEQGVKKAVKTSPKLAFFGGVKNCTNYHIVSVDGATHLEQTNTSYPYCGHLYDIETNGNGTSNLFDLCFNTPQDIYYPPLTDYPQNNLYKFYYNNYVSNLNSKDSKIVSLYFLLNTLDIKDLDFTTLVKVGNTKYYLNLIDGYNALSNELTRVELLKYIEVV